MVDCPSCHKPVEVTDQHFGTLFTCPFCSAVYFIDWNGQPELAQPDPESSEEQAPHAYSPDHEAHDAYSSAARFGASDSGFNAPEIQNPPENSSDEPTSFESTLSNSAFIASSDPMPLENSLGPIQPSGFDMPLENPYADEAVASSNDNYSSEGGAGSLEGLDESVAGVPASVDESSAPYDFSQPLDNVVPIVPATPDNHDFSDVTEFGNASVAIGPLAYTLIIEGIESSALMKELREAMMDTRFRWDVNGILQQARGGRLVIQGLDPAKAAIFLNRIKYLPFKLSWRQDVLSGN